MSNILFYDTNALLNLKEDAFKKNFVISQKTLQEIESIKVSINKDNSTKWSARQVAKNLSKYVEKYEVVPTTRIIKDIIEEFELNESPDNIIIASAFHYNKTHDDNVLIVTDDINMQFIAYNIFNLSFIPSKEVNGKEEEYKGYKEIVFKDDEDMASFYSSMNENKYKLLENEYLLLKDSNGKILEIRKWSNGTHEEVVPKSYRTNYMDVIKPITLNGRPDPYQTMVLNSLSTNTITMIKGHAGTGKSYLSIGYLFYLLEKNKIDKIIIFCNTVATLNSAKLGYYPGTKDEKLIESSIGNMLAAKLGGRFALEEMINKEKIVLLPMSDIRGYDTGKNCAVYITEAQNMDISLMKLCLQRIGDCVVTIIDGDYTTQVDNKEYSGSNNGMRRMSEVFRDHPFYGEIELQEIYRSEIAKLADKM